MTTKKPTAELLRAMTEDTSQGPPADKLDLLRGKCSEARDLEAEIEDVELRLADLKSSLASALSKTLPDMMTEIGVPSMQLAAQGNLQAVELKLTPFYSAGIAAKWPQEKKEIAYKYLDETGNGDLIKTELSLTFPREKRAEALKIVAMLKKEGLNPEVSESVNGSTLTAWLKEKTEDKEHVDLEKIGGYVGRTVKMKAVKDKA